MSHSAADVSIVIPVFNRPDLLKQVLECLAAQTFASSRMEILICDDGSTEDLSAVVNEFTAALPLLRLIRQPNKGPATARNLGTAHVSAPVIIYMDSDILPAADVVERLVLAMEQNPTWSGAEAAVKPTGGEENLLWDAPVCESGGVYLTAAIIYRTEIIQNIGGFDETYRRAACEDVELAARVMPYGEIGFVPEAVVEHPRRSRSLAYYWKKRNDWKYVTKLALRHGFMGWPSRKTNWPRLRVAVASIVTQPAHRLLTAVRTLFSRPAVGLTIGLHAIFGSFCGLLALPDVLLAANTPDCNYLDQHKPTDRVTQAA